MKISVKLIYLKNIVSFLTMTLIFASCRDKDEPVIESPTPRTVLVYMVASSNLGSMGYDSSDLAEMQKAVQEGQLGEGRLLVYHKPYNATPLLKEITPTGIDTLKTYDPDVVSVSIEQMQTVLTDMETIAPAEDYGLVLWSHATGWIEDGISQLTSGKQYSFGSDKVNNSIKKMNISSLAYALGDQRKYSFIYFDCCYMGNIETLYQLRNCAKAFVACATEDPIDGMPYHLNLKHFFSPTPDLKAAAQGTFDYYDARFGTTDCPVTLAVVQAEHLEELAAVTGLIYAQASTSYPAGFTPQKYSKDTPCYYYDFGQYVKAICADPELLDRWNDVYDSTVTYAVASKWIWGIIEIKEFSGLSTYILQTSTQASTNGYNTLQWYADVASHLPL